MCTGSRIQAGKRMGIRIHSPAFPSFLWVEGRKHTADNFAADPRGQKWGNMCRHDPEPGQNLPSHQKNIYFYMRLLHNSWSLGNVIDYLQNFFFIYLYIFQFYCAFLSNFLLKEGEDGWTIFSRSVCTVHPSFRQSNADSTLHATPVLVDSYSPRVSSFLLRTT